MGRITLELLRKRSEHNEGEIHSMEELALHQEKLEKIELIDKVCRNLKILLLQNNAIGKIENVSRLKQLEYLNLALNTVEKIENLEGCESLKKLDLTLNFIGELTSVTSLQGLENLEQLYLVGNPCHDFTGYRDYVVGALPQLKTLDGRDISKTERIKASQQFAQLESLIISQQKKHFENQQEEKIKANAGAPPPETKEADANPNAKEKDDDDDDDEEFWQKKAADTPQVRKEIARRLEKQEEKKKPKVTKKSKPPRKLTTEDGKPLNINEPKIAFSLHDEFNRSQLVLDLAVPKHMCTTLIDADVQPTHVKVTMKGKVFQLVLPEEVKPDSSYAQRSQVTGHLLITLPKVYDSSSLVWAGKDSTHTQQLVDLTNAKNTPNTIAAAAPVAVATNAKGKAGASSKSNASKAKSPPAEDPPAPPRKGRSRTTKNLSTGSTLGKGGIKGIATAAPTAPPPNNDNELPPPLIP